MRIISLVLFISLGCCSNPHNSEIEKSLLSFNCSVNYVNEKFDSYKSIYDDMRKSISQKAENNVRNYSNYKFSIWSLDSLILTNSSMSLCIGAAYSKKRNRPKSTSERIDVFYGYKLEGKWYFRKHQSIIYPRLEYQSQSYTPMTFDMLKYLARTIELNPAYRIMHDSITPREEFLRTT